MPRTIQTTVYKFNELTDDAKEKARDWYKESAQDDYQFAFENTVEDAAMVDLEVEYLSERETNKGKFKTSAEATAKKVLEEHGPDCDTRKESVKFLADLEALNTKYPEDEEGYRGQEHEDEKEELEKEFLRALLEDYRVMYGNDCEYRMSNEAVDETIEANEYEFLESGKRA